MGWLSGFGVTLRQIGRPKVTEQLPEGEATEAGALPRPPRPQPLRGRHGEVHRLRALRRRVPGEVHLRARRRQPARRAGVAGRALRLRLRDQLPPLHPLRPVRRGVPHRGDHRDEALRVLVRQPRGRDLHQGRAARRRRRPRPPPAVGAVARRRGRPHQRVDARDRARPGRRVYEGRVGWSGELGFGVRPPEVGQSADRCPHGDLTPPPEEPVGARDDRTSGGHHRWTAVIFFLFAALALAGALGVVLARNPVHSALFARRDARERRGVLPAAGRAAARGGAGHRLRRRDRRAVPVRDHAARRRPRRHRCTTRCASSGRPRSCSASSLLAEVLFLAGHEWATGAKSRRPRDAIHGGAPASATTSSASRASLFTDFLWPFEITAALLVLAVVGAVVLARRSGRRSSRSRPSRGAREPGQRRR